MRRSSDHPKAGMRTVGIAMAGLLVAGMAVLFGTSMASAHTGGMQMSTPTAQGRVGTTKGWYDGKTVTFHYSKAFFCRMPPHSKAASHCELGANYQVIPASNFDPLYVVVPLGFKPNSSTLACPTAGRCIDHPHRLDLTRVFGTGTGDALLPPHSHIVTTAASGQAEWWNVDVVGVSSRAAWHQIVAGKSYHVIQRLRNHHNAHVTANLTTNLFLYFSVK
ncbi:MAG: hypothetical protein ACRDPG_12140 [Nocardioidaceae bacterium]